MDKKRKILAVFFAVSFILVMLYSVLFISMKLNHDCVGEDCPICYQISICQDTLRKLSLAFCTAVFLTAFTHILCKNASFLNEYSHSYTLVSLKVKLSD